MISFFKTSKIQYVTMFVHPFTVQTGKMYQEHQCDGPHHKILKLNDSLAYGGF